VDRLYISIGNKTKKLLAIAVSCVERGLRGRDDGGNANNLQHKTNWKCHYNSPHTMNIS
jgi:hypothetical protein